MVPVCPCSFIGFPKDTRIVQICFVCQFLLSELLKLFANSNQIRQSCKFSENWSLGRVDKQIRTPDKRV